MRPDVAAPARGFTLVELLVALVVLSLLMVGLMGAMRTLGQSADRIETRLRALDEQRVAQHFLREVLSRAAPVRPPASAGSDQGRLLFRAQADQLEWIGVMPARAGAGGLYHFRLQALAHTAQVPALASQTLRAAAPSAGPSASAPFAASAPSAAAGVWLLFAPYAGPQAPPPNWAQADGRLLVPGHELRLAYQDAGGQWLSAWELDRLTLPQRIRVEWVPSASVPPQNTAAAWPPLQVALLGWSRESRLGATGQLVVGGTAD